MQNKSIVPLPGEVWKDISWTDGIYQVSSCGRLRRVSDTYTCRFCFVLTQRPKTKGYLYVRLKFHGHRKEVIVHKLVAEAFLGPRPHGLVVNHKDGIKSHNGVSNLEYCTVAENNAHAFRLRLQIPHSFAGRKMLGYAASRFLGVRRGKSVGRWEAQMKIGKVFYSLGTHGSEERAALAYWSMRRIMERPRRFFLDIAV